MCLKNLEVFKNQKEKGIYSLVDFQLELSLAKSRIGDGESQVLAKEEALQIIKNESELRGIYSEGYSEGFNKILRNLLKYKIEGVKSIESKECLEDYSQILKKHKSDWNIFKKKKIAELTYYEYDQSEIKDYIEDALWYFPNDEQIKSAIKDAQKNQHYTYYPPDDAGSWDSDTLNWHREFFTANPTGTNKEFRDYAKWKDDGNVDLDYDDYVNSRGFWGKNKERESDEQKQNFLKLMKSDPLINLKNLAKELNISFSDLDENDRKSFGKKLYRRLAKLLHPDRSRYSETPSEEKFKKLNEIWDSYRKKYKIASYNLWLHKLSKKNYSL